MSLEDPVLLEEYCASQRRSHAGNERGRLGAARLEGIMEPRVSWEELKRWDTNSMLNAAYAIEGTRRAARDKRYNRYGPDAVFVGRQESAGGSITNDCGADNSRQHHCAEHARTALEALFLSIWEVIKERDQIDCELSRYGWTTTASNRIVGTTRSRILTSRQLHLNAALESLLQNASRVYSEWRSWLMGTPIKALHYN